MDRVFISYAHASDEHKRRVDELVAALRRARLDVSYDKDVRTPQGPPEGWPRWMHDQLEVACWVLVVCEPFYLGRFDGKEAEGSGLGARWEGAIIRQELYDAGAINRKFIPILFEGASIGDIPVPLRGASRYQCPARLPDLIEALQGAATLEAESSADVPLTGEPASAVSHPRRAERSASTPPGGGPWQERELVVRLTVQGDQVEATYASPGRGPIRGITSTSPLADVADIAHTVAKARGEVIAREVTAARTGWGPKLFHAILAKWPAVLRVLHGNAAQLPQPTPASVAVRVSIVTTHPILRSLPWRLASWEGQLLPELDWTLATSTLDDAERVIHTPLRAHVLCAGAPSSGRDDLTAGVNEVLQAAWGERAKARLASASEDLFEALDNHAPPHLLILHGRVVGPEADAHLVPEGGAAGTRVSFTELARRVRDATETSVEAVAALYLDVTWDVDAAAVVQPLLDSVPLVIWRQTQAGAAAEADGLTTWLRSWLTDYDDPVVAWHKAHASTSHLFANTAPTVLHANYRKWTTQHGVSASAGDSARKFLDRRSPKSVLFDAVTAFVDHPGRRVVAFVVCGTRGHAVSTFTADLEAHFERRHLGLRVRRIPLLLTHDAEDLPSLLGADLREQLRRPEDDLDEPLTELLRRAAPRRGQWAGTLLWLDWQISSLRWLDGRSIEAWVKFGAEEIASLALPSSLYIMWSMTVEAGGDAECADVLGVLSAARESAWYRRNLKRFHLADVSPLEHVQQNDIDEYLTHHTQYDDDLRASLAALIFKASSNGHFEQAVALLEEGRCGAWSALHRRLRQDLSPTANRSEPKERP